MTFRPLTLDGQQAAQRLLSWGKYTPLHCLEAVHRAFPFDQSDHPGAYTSARVQWDRTPTHRRRTGTPPAGAIVFWDLYVSDLGYSPGHIAISLGGGRVVSTDWPSRGQVGIGRIDAITERWGARYLGWTDVIGGHDVTTAQQPTPTTPNRPLPEVNDMAIIIRRNTDGIIGLVAPELWAHMPDEQTANINAAVYSTADEIHDLDPAEFDRVTRSAGIPDHVRAEGVFWSRASEISAALAKLTA